AHVACELADGGDVHGANAHVAGMLSFQLALEGDLAVTGDLPSRLRLGEALLHRLLRRCRELLTLAHLGATLLHLQIDLVGGLRLRTLLARKLDDRTWWCLTRPLGGVERPTRLRHLRRPALDLHVRACGDSSGTLHLRLRCLGLS